MSSGIVFDIKEFAVFDGPGIRTTVFFKGCPMRCAWCHNPEGFRADTELMVSSNSCIQCGRCNEVCPRNSSISGALNNAACTACGACVGVCPLGLRRIVGTEYEAADLAQKLLRNAPYLMSAGGGFTVSGGEPSAQGEFLLELLGLLRGNHRAVETSGYCSDELFRALVDETELLLLDLKLVDSQEHRRWTGVDNALIMKNLEYVKKNGKPFIVRIPLIPGVNDTLVFFETAAVLLEGNSGLIRVELLPFHKTAGAKYSMLGLSFKPGFDPGKEPLVDSGPFERKNIPCMAL